MKDKILLLALVSGLGMTQISAQPVYFGVKAEATLSNFIMQDVPNLKSRMDGGVTVGGFANIPLSGHFALQPELLFRFNESKFEQTDINRKNHFEYWGFEIPVYAVGSINLWQGKAYLGIGPYGSFGVDAKYNIRGCHTGVYKKDDETNERLMQRWDVGAGAILGYEFNNGLQINAGYKIGFIDVLDAGKSESTMLNQLISLGIGYRF